jgi:3-isopropylmalate/(R)-2-methylmalate dehydratase small subunit
MQIRLEGNAWLFGDDVDTDVIIPAKYLVTFDPAELGPHCFEGIDPTLAARIQPGDVVVGGRNFGCGSSREHAPIAMKGLGVSCVIAPSYGQIFYRNAFNLGLPALEAELPAQAIRQGDRLKVDLSTGTIRNLTTNATFETSPIPPFMQQLIEAGGLMPYVLRSLGEKAGS